MINENQQKQSTDAHDPNGELISTVTATVLQILKTTDQISGESRECKNSKKESETVDLTGMFFCILERFWVVLVSAVLCGTLMGMAAKNNVTTYSATSKLYIVNKDSFGIKMADLQLGTALTSDYQEVFKTWEVHEMVIINAPHLVDVSACIPVLLQVFLRVIPCHGGVVVKPDGKLTIAVGVDVFGVAAFQHLAAGFLPAVACQCDAERAGIPMGNPGPLGPVADGVFQGGIGPGTLDQATDAVGQVGRVLDLGGVHHAGHLAIVCRCGRFGGGNPGVGRFGQCIIHLAGQLGAALAVLCHQRGGVSNQRIGIPGAVGVPRH